MEEVIEGGSESDSMVSCLSSSNQELGLGPGPDISHLPWEVLQDIFCHLDGKSLLICKRVCKSWRDHVHHLEQKKSFWYDNCQNEISSSTQFDLLDNMFPCHWKDQSGVDWGEIYKCWYVWKNLFEAPVKIYDSFSVLSGISSIKVSGEWLLISTCEGTGKLVAHRLTGSGGLIDMYVGGGAILNFELVISDRHPYSNVRPPTVLEEIFDTMEHNEIWLELKDCYIQLGKTYCHHLDKIQQKIRHSYGYEVRLVSDRSCSSIILKKTCNKVHGPELLELELSSPYSQIVDFWTSTISLGDMKFGKQIMVDAVSVNRKNQQVSLTCSLSYNPNVEICNTYSWHGSLFVLYTSKRKIMMHHNGEEEVQVTPIKKGRVTSVLFYANNFFLGTDAGKLLVYNVKSPEDCLKINVYTTTSWNIEVCQGKIIHIAVAEPIHHKRKCPVIICATPEDIYLVSISL